MTIAIQEVFTAGREGSIDTDWTRTYKRVFQATTSSALIGPVSVIQAIPVSLGATYQSPFPFPTEFDTGAYCQKISASQGNPDDGRDWLVTLDYGPIDPTVYPENPLLHPIDVRWSFAQFSRVVDETVDAPKPLPVVNSAFDAFDPPVEIDDSRPILTLVRNEQTFNHFLAHDLKDSINTGVFLDFGPYTVKCMDIQAERVLSNIPAVLFYWRVTYEFAINDDRWIKTILNQGMRQVKADLSGWEQIIIKGGPITSPALLDSGGRALAPHADPVYLDFRVFKERDFSVFGFPPLPA